MVTVTGVPIQLYRALAVSLHASGVVQVFEKRLVAGWGDMDFNSHMRNTAFLDKSADVRMMFFSENGFPVEEFIRRKIGPVIRKDEVEYFREIQLLEEVRVTLAIAGLAEDGSRFVIRNEFWRADENVAAKVTSAGGWLDQTIRRLVAPPEALLAALRSLARTDDFQILSSSIKKS
jgi:acyl-CoA thioester hydrolase